MKFENYQIYNKFMLFRYWRLILFVLAIIGLLGGIFWTAKKFLFNGGEIKTYQVLVSVYDEKNSDPVEDKKSSMKKGYVIGVYPENHEWSQTEKVSYLILKMKLNEKEAIKIVDPVEKEIDIKSLTEEQQRYIKENDRKEEQKEVVSARKYRINLEKIGFSDPNSLLNGQPYLDKVFGWGIMERIK